jgi:two-component system OmpR family response regulator
MADAKILIVDDDPAIRNLIGRFLASQGYMTQLAETGTEGLSLFRSFNPDLVILDVNLPDHNGYNLCTEMQEMTGVLVLLLTSRDDEADKLRGFAQGADDYITKPFIISELGARVGALIKRSQRTWSATINEDTPLRVGSLLIDPAGREAFFMDQPLPLTALEFDLLKFLMENMGRAWRRGELVEQVWRDQSIGDNRVVDVHIGQIRRKIEKIDPNFKSSQLIQTVRGVGYKLEAADELS